MGPQLTRFENWPTPLIEFIYAANQRLFSWGEFDCFIFCADAIQALTGEDVFKDYEFRGKYKSAEGAIKQFKKHGFKNIEHIWDEFLEPVHPNYAQRGDIVLLDLFDFKIPASGVVIDSRAAFLSPDDIIYKNVTDARLSWRVGA